MRGVDLDLYDGELVVLLGPSGSGKSTLLNILGGLDSATSGTVYYLEHNLVQTTERELTRYRRHHVGFVFQFYNLIPSLTARENVATRPGSAIRRRCRGPRSLPGPCTIPRTAQGLAISRCCRDAVGRGSTRRRRGRPSWSPDWILECAVATTAHRRRGSGDEPRADSGIRPRRRRGCPHLALAGSGRCPHRSEHRHIGAPDPGGSRAQVITTRSIRGERHRPAAGARRRLR